MVKVELGIGIMQENRVLVKTIVFRQPITVNAQTAILTYKCRTLIHKYL